MLSPLRLMLAELFSTGLSTPKRSSMCFRRFVYHLDYCSSILFGICHITRKEEVGVSSTLCHTQRRARWCRGMFGALQPEGFGFESTSSRRVGTLGKSFTRNCSCASA